MTVSQQKQRQMFNMFQAGTFSQRKIKKAVHKALSTIEDYKKIYDFLVSAKPLPVRLQRAQFSSRFACFKAFLNESPAQQQYTPPRINPHPSDDRSRNTQSQTTDALVYNQQIALWLSRDLEQSEQKNTELEKKLKEMTRQQDNDKLEKQQLLRKLKQKNQENEELKQNNTELIRENRALHLEDQEQKNTINTQRALINKMQYDHQKELYEKVSQKETIMRNDHAKELQRINKGVTIIISKLDHEKQKNKILTAERDKYKSELDWLIQEQETNKIKNAAITITVFGIGTVVGGCAQQAYTNCTNPSTSQKGTTSNPGYKNLLILEEATGQPNLTNTTNGVLPGTTPVETLYPEIGYQTNGALSSIHCDVSSHQTCQTNQLHSQNTWYGESLTTPQSDSFSSTFCVSTNIIINTSPVIPSLYEDTRPQNTLTYYTPWSLLNNPWDSFLLNQIKRTTGKEFEDYMQRVFEYLGYRVTRTTPSCDFGADLILEMNGIKTVVQLKQWKENVGKDAVQQVYASKDYHKAASAMVICTSEFTKSALELASSLNVACWDGQRLLKELNQWQYFSPPK